MKKGFDLSDELSQIPKKKFHKIKKEKKIGTKTGFKCSFFTIVLIFCLCQIGYGAILNVSKIISYKGKMMTLENLLRQAELRNQDLKNEKKVVTSDNCLEGIARNNLKMAGEDEVLIIINKKQEEPVKKKSFWNIKPFWSKDNNIKEDEQTAEHINIPTEVVEE